MHRRLLVLILVCCGPAWGQALTPVGLWQTVSDRTGQPAGLVRIVEIDGEYTGTVVAVFSPPAPDAHPLCELCQGELKDKPVVGMMILRGVRQSGEGFSAGQILDPDEGRVYRCRIALLEDGRKLEVRGYIGIPLFGRSQTWVRKE
ncbi:MAG TPA: DUF2147 domain-containing protein [Burkholderiales bacterium]|nr:DUF2147 domain-containing protein [Burkholderiales bacterium]